jgi:hypothetical protein
VIAQAKMAANSQPVKHPVAQPGERLPAKPNAPRRNPVVQRYTKETIQNMGGQGKLSENEHYFIPDADQKSIYVEAKTAHEPHISKDTTAALQTYNSKQYKKYKPIGQYYQDCLHTAEEIMAGGDLDFKSSDRSRVAGTKGKAGLFGQKPSKNIKLAQRYHKQFDNDADPYVGQAYAIVNKKWKDRRHKDPGLGRYPFHAAAVVARDGKDRITLEVHAGEDEAKGRNTDGKYYMYEAGATATQGRTFHEVQSATGDFSAGPYTLVIAPK